MTLIRKERKGGKEGEREKEKMGKQTNI